MGQPIQQQERQHVDRLNQILLDGPVADIAGDSRGQARHARKRPADHGQQVIGDEVVVRIADDLRLRRRLAPSLPQKDGPPEKDLRDDRQEPHQRAESEIAPIDQPFFEADSQDRPPDCSARKHTNLPALQSARASFLSTASFT